MPQYRLRFAFLVAAIAVGMLLAAGTASAQPATDVTFSKDVASILYEKCARCHREGEIAPMSLLTYAETRPWARAIKQKVLSREMPPWHADPQFGRVSERPPADANGDRHDRRVGRRRLSRGTRGRPATTARVPRRLGNRNTGRRLLDARAIPGARRRDRPVPALRHSNKLHRRQVDRASAGDSRQRQHPAPHRRLRSRAGAGQRVPGCADQGSYRPAQDGATPRQQRLLPGSVLVATGVGTEPAQYEDGSAMLVRAGAELIMENPLHDQGHARHGPEPHRHRLRRGPA